MGKLMKYELRSMLKLFVPLWIGVLALAVVNRFTSNMNFGDNRLLNTLMAIAVVLYVLAVAGIVIFAEIYVILRFYQGLMKDEGYLTFTLPISIDSLLWGKALSALLVMLVSGVVSMVSILLILWQTMNLRIFDTPFREAAEFLGGGNLTLIIVMVIVAIILSAITSILQLYLAMGIGQMAQKHRVGASILAYVGINIVLNMITSLAITPWMERIMENSAFMWRIETAGDVMHVIWTIFAILAVSCLILGAVYYFITRYIFSRRLNLE